MVRILVVDDHSFIRKGVKLMLAGIPDMEVAQEAEQGDEALAALRTATVDVVLLDINLPGKDGLDVLKQIKIEHPNLPVIMLSMMPEKQYAVRCFKAGASGYLAKNCKPGELIKAIRTASSGGNYVSEALAEHLVLGLTDTSDGLPHQALSDREYQVLCQIASGKTPTEIAETLVLSIKTVSTYRSRILQKMKMKTTAELTHYALKNNLVE